MKIMFCGGGTVGHISPAIAIAEDITKKYKDAEILFVGRHRGDENRIITSQGFQLETIKIRGIERRLTFRNFKNIYTAFKAQSEAKKIIKAFSPDIVFGTGGYVCWPILTSAHKMEIPTIIHESNAAPGLATRLLSTKCDRVLLGLEGSQKEFKKQDNLFVVGNPVKEEFKETNKASARKRLRIPVRGLLISSFGGSGGSEVLNNSMINLMKSYCTKKKEIYHIHSCGKRYFEKIKESHPELTTGRYGCIIKPYIENMADIMAASDIVISRCGAITLAELSCVGCASILIPSPNVTNDHQTKNARLISEAGAAIMINESELSERSLLDTVRRLETSSELRRKLESGIKNFYVPDCTKVIIKHIEELTS